MHIFKNIGLSCVFLVVMLSLFIACSDDESSSGLGAFLGLEERACSYSITTIDDYRLIETDDCNVVFALSDGTYRNKDFSPIAGNNPSPERENYFFLVRDGDPTRVLINFMGGGACWDGANCLDYVTNTTYSDIEAFSPENITAEKLSLFTPLMFNGIIDNGNSENPFKDWTLVFLPYTTGDVHWGSNDQVYTDSNGNQVTVHHRGFDNFLSVLRYVKDTYPPGTVDRIFVTGQSAGSYGAIYTFPYIKETYPGAIVDMLGDGGAGVNPRSFVEDSIDHWKARDNLPDWVYGIDASTFADLSMGDFYKAVADYYPDSRLAQYTTMYDTNQRFYYYVMLEIDNPDAWRFLGNKGYGVPDSVTCDWKNDMLAQKTTAENASNYKAYIAPGEVHTITTDVNMYYTVSNGIYLLDWINMMLSNDATWQSVVCQDCDPPATLESSAGIVCP